MWVLSGLGSTDWPGRGFSKVLGLLMGVLCAGMWVSKGLGSVDARFVRRHVGFKRFWIYWVEFCEQALGFKRFGIC